MSKTIRHVLKADEVALDDSFPLSLDPAAAAAPGATSRPAPAAPAGPGVRITQSHPDYAVIEVTCPCGRTTSIRCDYAAASPSPVQQEPSQG